MADNRAFISYRRAPGYPWARLIWEDLGERDVDAFLDLESMRSAGTFDDRLLNQIASRPYFLVVLTPGTLERCSDPQDWVRREIEHAIDHGRVVVPVFIAPFEPSGFPADLPQHIGDALRRSQGVTVYSQYLSAAIDKLAFEMLTPVDLASPVLTEEDARFQSQTVREIRSLPAPTVPETPAPDAVDAFEVPAPTIEAPAGGAVDSTPPASPRPSEPSELDETVELDPLAPTAAVGEVAREPVELAPEPIAEPAPEPVDLAPEPIAEPTHEPVELAPEPTPEPTPFEVRSPDDAGRPTGRRRWLVAGGLALVLAVVVGVVAAQSGGGDDPGANGVLEADVWLRPGDAVRAVTGDHELVMTEAGQLQLQSGGRVTWAPSYAATSTASAILQRSDGNLVVYRSDDADSGALWASGTTSVGSGGELRVGDDRDLGVVSIVDRNDIERWNRPEPADALDALIGIDRPAVEARFDGWVVQLGAKFDGQVENGAWDHARILEDHLAARERFGDVDVVLADGGADNLGLDRWFVTLVVDEFADADAAFDWCQRFQPGNCGIKFLSADPNVPAQARFT